jgi:hypothetical protein
MNRDEFETLLETLQESELSLNRTKGQEYAGTDDALSNFKRIARELDISPLVVCYVYFHKHIDSIRSYVKNPGSQLSESLQSRFADARLYLALMYALTIDQS